MRLNNHGEFFTPRMEFFLPFVLFGIISASFFVLMVFKYRRVELDENGINILGLSEAKIQIPWKDIQYLRRARLPLPEAIIFKVKPIDKKSFYFRSDYEYLLGLFKKQDRQTAMERFITEKKREYKIKSDVGVRN